MYRIFIIFWVFYFVGCKSSPNKRIIDNVSGINSKPNVVFILADDLGLYDLSATGSVYYETPNIDTIAKEGTVFTQGYAASRVCSPSRASIMLGQATARHGITDWIGAAYGDQWRAQGHNDKVLPSTYNHSLPKENVPLAQVMKDAGYQTFFAGKWHLGEKQNTPENSGFDVNKGGWEVGSPIGGYFSPWDNPKLENKKLGENLSVRLGEETADFIEAHKDKPFFAMLSFYAVHGPIETTEERWKKFRDKAEAKGIAENGFEMERKLPIRIVQDNPIYAGLIEQMDVAVGLVLSKLRELDLDKNTIVVFTSDNGGVASGDAFSTSNLPLRGGKGYQWEGGIREPYFIKAPFIANAPSEVDVAVSGIDFYPTILDLVGIDLYPHKNIDGVSLLPLLQNQNIKERPLFWHYPHYGNQGGEPSSIIRKGKFKLIHYWEDNRNELYDLEEDPSEKTNIANKHSETVNDLYIILDEFLEEVNAKIPLGDPLFDEEKSKQLHLKNKEILLPQLEAQRLRFLARNFKPNATWWDSKATTD